MDGDLCYMCLGAPHGIIVAVRPSSFRPNQRTYNAAFPHFDRGPNSLPIPPSTDPGDSTMPPERSALPQDPLPEHFDRRLAAIRGTVTYHETRLPSVCGPLATRDRCCVTAALIVAWFRLARSCGCECAWGGAVRFDLASDLRAVQRQIGGLARLVFS